MQADSPSSTHDGAHSVAPALAGHHLVLAAAVGFLAIPSLIVLAVAFAWLGHALTGLSVDDIILSYAPGGFAEMSLVGLALHADIAMVATHHLFRIFLVVMGGGLLFRLLIVPKLKAPAAADDHAG